MFTNGKLQPVWEDVKPVMEMGSNKCSVSFTGLSDLDRSNQPAFIIILTPVIFKRSYRFLQILRSTAEQCASSEVACKTETLKELLVFVDLINCVIFSYCHINFTRSLLL